MRGHLQCCEQNGSRREDTTESVLARERSSSECVCGVCVCVVCVCVE